MPMSLDARGKAHVPAPLSRTSPGLDDTLQPRSMRLSRVTLGRRSRHRSADLHTRLAGLRASKIMAKAKQPQTPSADASARMTTAEATVAALITHGVDTIYALPGVHNDSFFDALFKAAAPLRVVPPRHKPRAPPLPPAPALP